MYAQQHAIVVAALGVVSVTFWIILRRWKGLPLTVLGLLVIHPAWTISATKGDCGYAKAEAATFATAVAVACIAIQLFAWVSPAIRRKHAVEGDG